MIEFWRSMVRPNVTYVFTVGMFAIQAYLLTHAKELHEAGVDVTNVLVFSIGSLFGTGTTVIGYWFAERSITKSAVGSQLSAESCQKMDLPKAENL